MFKYRIRMFLNELKVLVFMRSDSRQSESDAELDRRSGIRGIQFGDCGWPTFNCSSRDDEEEYYGTGPRPSSTGIQSRNQGRAPESMWMRWLCALHPPAFASSDGSVKEGRGSWSCELCYFKYQVLAISTKNPLQWQTISLTVIERVQIAAIILASLFLVASVSWLVWSLLSPSAKRQRQDLLFQICYGMYGFMDIVCIGLMIHEGSSVYQIFKRWQAVNQQWKVLNYEKVKDLEDPASSSSKEGGQRLWSWPHTSGLSAHAGHTGQHIMTLLHHHCGYTLQHILSHLRPSEHHLGTATNHEVVMRVTTV